MTPVLISSRNSQLVIYDYFSFYFQVSAFLFLTFPRPVSKSFLGKCMNSCANVMNEVAGLTCRIHFAGDKVLISPSSHLRLISFVLSVKRWCGLSLCVLWWNYAVWVVWWKANSFSECLLTYGRTDNCAGATSVGFRSFFIFVFGVILASAWLISRSFWDLIKIHFRTLEFSISCLQLYFWTFSDQLRIMFGL